MSYEGPAIIIGEGTEIEAEIELRANLSEPLKSWGGSGTASLAGPPPLLLDQVTIRLPNGREGTARVDMSWGTGDTHTRVEIHGSGMPPFDV
ncbi:DUF4873 domain-containing protein [Nonomuraea sp. NPDC050394]|uniref:DUF4873 domain-containing protein n=1 Tax=Nonomuraea sp. NPDC050394 TaxID=3364363 RepID=UPI0037A6C2DE